MSAPVLIAGKWRPANSSGTFRGENPTTSEPIPEEFPISTWADCDAALDAATAAFAAMRTMPAERIAKFLDAYAATIEANADALVAIANTETALPVAPRLKDVELPRTVSQLRQAAAAAREGSWAMPTIDTKLNIRSCLAPIGPVWVFGPNNFPFAFNSIAGGDFAAAIAAGNPVIAKANTSHPGTTRIFGELAQQAAEKTGMPPGIVQLIYRTSHADGQKLVADPRTGATGYTGSRGAGLALKAAGRCGRQADLFGAFEHQSGGDSCRARSKERGEKLAEEFTGSCLMGAGQFCTNPGLVLLLGGPETQKFIDNVATASDAAPVGTLLSSRVAKSLTAAVQSISGAGAEILAGGKPGGGKGDSYANTLLRVTGSGIFEKRRSVANRGVWQ